MENEIFYNKLSAGYDGMINFDSALSRRIDLLSTFIKPGYKSAADIGCGSGIDSISLSKLGLNVMAFDPSNEMLNHARINATEYNISDLRFINKKVNQIESDYLNQFDFVTSLGNTVSNIPPAEIDSSFEIMYKLLHDSGSMLIQTVNYNKLIHEDKRILSITKNEIYTFVRFYDFYESQIIFNILQFENKNPNKYDLISTEVYHYSVEYFNSLLNKAGFNRIEFWGDFKQKPFEEKLSKDLIIFASK